MRSIIESIIGRRGSNTIRNTIREVPVRKENLEGGDTVQLKSGKYRIFLVADFNRNGMMRAGFYEDRYMCDISHFDGSLECDFDHDNDVVRIFKTSQLPNISLKFPTYTGKELEKIIKTGRA